eukprot:4355085-Amphidinium_carterae.1
MGKKLEKVGKEGADPQSHKSALLCYHANSIWGYGLKPKGRNTNFVVSGAKSESGSTLRTLQRNI